MKRLAIAVLLCLGCTSPSDGRPSPRNEDYELKVENYHRYDVVIYVIRGGTRARIGRVDAHADRSLKMRYADVLNRSRLMVCVGAYTPINRTCSVTDPVHGQYPGVVLLHYSASGYAWVNGE